MVNRKRSTASPIRNGRAKSLIMSAYAYDEAGSYDDCINAHLASRPTPPRRSISSARPILHQIPEISRDLGHRAASEPRRGRRNILAPSAAYVFQAEDPDCPRSACQGDGRWASVVEASAPTPARSTVSRLVVTRYQRTRHVEEALLRLTEAYIRRSASWKRAQTSAGFLGHNFPDSRWYKDAYALMELEGGWSRTRTREKSASRSKGVQKLGSHRTLRARSPPVRVPHGRRSGCRNLIVGLPL